MAGWYTWYTSDTKSNSDSCTILVWCICWLVDTWYTNITGALWDYDDTWFCCLYINGSFWYDIIEIHGLFDMYEIYSVYYWEFLHDIIAIHGLFDTRLDISISHFCCHILLVCLTLDWNSIIKNGEENLYDKSCIYCHANKKVLLSYMENW